MTAMDRRPNSFEMSTEDQYRIARLYEEVSSRLEEMALIGARVTGIPLTPDTVRKFAPHAGADFTYDVDIEIICGPTACGCMYRDASGNWAWAYPCA
ncbi:hypothetical protein QGN32_20000 [Mycolicibacterium sp. ND9-15]|uniref:hypothetical protein n=1 Tax=Mycolicibacterium sp. ND9-15 TaxID=3042320 RepID=UPI002DDB9FEC|nr:hypothetical protein [Mycolicibacterium sp. ND9-15]WSE55664.1 hypothetical protein QGN32_20000 [Mycolicibacterium sp. ND9-15]